MTIGESNLRNISQSALDDVVDYLQENGLGSCVADLSPQEFLRYWLEWNGIIGWSREIVALVESLGWSLGGNNSEQADQK
jgi:hypothetical protein